MASEPARSPLKQDVREIRRTISRLRNADLPPEKWKRIAEEAKAETARTRALNDEQWEYLLEEKLELRAMQQRVRELEDQSQDR